jgi:hypothetical protein
LSPVRVWSSVGRNLSGSSGFATAPIGKMYAASKTRLTAANVVSTIAPRCNVLPIATRASVAAVTRGRAASETLLS